MSESQALTVLKQALISAKEKLRTQGEMLARLTKEPLRFATVIAIRVPAPVVPAPPKDADVADFEKGTSVRILRGDFTGEVGTLLRHVGDGDVHVRLVSKQLLVCNVDPQFEYRLERSFAEPLSPKEQFLVGAKYRVITGRHAGMVGELLDYQDKKYLDLQYPVERNIGYLRFDGACHLGETCKHDYFLDLPRTIELVDAVASERKATAIVLFDGKEVEVELPEEPPVHVGDTVKLSMQTLQIVDVVSTLLAGEVVGVQKVLDDASCEVDFQGGTRAVYSGRFSGQLKDGDRVVLDPSGLVVIRNLGQEDQKDTLFAFTEKTHVSWDSIGGLDDAKRQLIEAIELPYRFAEHYAFYGKKPLKGLLLYGPPGCGKTMLGKAAATALAQLHDGKGADTCFMYVKAPEILNKFIGTSEATVRRLFAAARAHKAAHGYPAVIFIDEADAILGKRGSGISSDIERTIVPMFLAEMDGFDESAAVVLLATNRADTLDPAIVRDGRIDRKVKVDRPTAQTAPTIFGLHLASVPLNNGYTHQKLAARATAELFSPTRVLYELHLKDGGCHPFTFGHLASGALIAGIADRATSRALARDIAAGVNAGLRAEDLDAAVQDAFLEIRDLNHDDEVRAFATPYGREVARIETRRFAAAGGAS